MRSVPAEVLDNVFHFLEDDLPSLSVCTCVSHHIWSQFASRRLFRLLKFHAVIGNPHSHATFRDFFSFVKSCPRASTFTRSLVLDGSWPQRHRGNCMEPVFVSRLAIDTLSDIITVLPALRTLELRAVQLSMPDLMFRIPQPATFTLDQLNLDYTTAHPLAQPDGRPGFDVSSILPMFSFIGKLEIRYGLQLNPSSHSHVFALKGARLATRISDFELRMFRPDDVVHVLRSLTEIAAPHCLLKLRILVDGWWDAKILACAHSFLACPASRNLQTLYVHWGWGIKKNIERSEQLFPVLGSMQQLSSIILTQALSTNKNFDFARNTFAATISALLSILPARHHSLTAASIRKARLNFIIGRLSPVEDVPSALGQLPWHELDRVVGALGWAASNSKEVAAYSTSSEDYSIEVHLTVAGEDLPNVTFIQAQDVILSKLNPRTQKLLRISSSRRTTSSGCSDDLRLLSMFPTGFN